MKLLDRRALFASGAAAALLAATGVSATPSRGGHLRAALSGATRADRWKDTGDRFLQTAASAVFEGLTELAADGTLRGEIATAWSGSADARVWSFTLREAVFHDGLPLKSEDIAATVKHLGDVLPTKEGIRLELTEADPNLPYRLAQPEYLIKPANSERRAEGIGTGLYKVHKFDPGRHFIGTRIAAHWKDGTAGWFDKVEMVHFKSDAVRAQALREGLVDVADITALDALTDVRAFQRLPTDALTHQIASHRIAVPSQVGRAMPLDNLRMAERWWIA